MPADPPADDPGFTPAVDVAYPTEIEIIDGPGQPVETLPTRTALYGPDAPSDLVTIKRERAKDLGL